LVQSEIVGDYEGVKQRAVFTLGDFQRVLARRQRPGNKLVIMVVAVNLVPVPRVSRLDRIKSHPTCARLIGILVCLTCGADYSDPERVVRTGGGYDLRNDLVDSGVSGETVSGDPFSPWCCVIVVAVAVIGAYVRSTR